MLTYHGPSMKLRTPVGLALAASIALAGCTSDGADDPPVDAGGTGPSGEPVLLEPASITLPAGPTAVLGGATADALAIEASQTFFGQSPVVVLVAGGDDPTGAAAIAVELGVPLLPTPSAAPASDGTASPSTPTPPATGSPAPSAPADDGSATTDELTRLEASVVVAVGAGATTFAEALPDGITVVTAPDGAAAVGDLPADALPEITAAETPAPFAALTLTGTETAAASATVQAAGGVVHELTAPDPRTDSAVIAALAAEKPAFVAGLGAEFGTPEQLAYRVGVAQTGVELPGGGQVLYPYHRHIALYGNPTTSALGSLGEQSLPEAITRAQDLAAEYQALIEETAVPTFELIASVASSVPSSGGDYSTEMTPEVIRPYVDAAREAGVYVVLDLQPGRLDFLTQAKVFEEFLREPHVGLALDPEWRLRPGEVHLEQVGSVSAEEVNSVVTWLADLTRDNNLPQKVLVLHQFRTDMVSDRTQVDTSRDELAVLVHVDGFGPPGSKLATWNAIRADPPPNVWWGWKNFIDEDSPTFTPDETMQLEPVPHFVSYQ